MKMLSGQIFGLLGQISQILAWLSCVPFRSWMVAIFQLSFLPVISPNGRPVKRKFGPGAHTGSRGSNPRRQYF